MSNNQAQNSKRSDKRKIGDLINESGEMEKALQLFDWGYPPNTSNKDQSANKITSEI